MRCRLLKDTAPSIQEMLGHGIDCEDTKIRELGIKYGFSLWSLSPGELSIAKPSPTLDASVERKKN